MTVTDVSDEALHDLFQAIEGIDTDHPDYVERFEDWAADYRTDLAIERSGG